MDKKPYVIVGCLIIMHLIYYKFIIIRLPKDITQVYWDLCCFILLMYSLRLVSLLYTGIKAKYFPEQGSNKFILKVKSYFHNISNIYQKSLQAIDDFIKHTLLGPRILGANLKILCPLLIKLLGVKHKTYKWLYVFFDILPKSILLLLFSLDILYCKQFHYIYQVAWLTLLPIMFHYIVFTLKEFCDFNIHLIITKFIEVQSIQKNYSFNMTDIIRECCHTYHEDIFNMLPDDILHRTEAMPINIGHAYILRDNVTSWVNNTIEDPDIFFDRILVDFNVFRIIRELVYKIEQCSFYWKTLFFQVIRYSIYTYLWWYILIHLQKHFLFDYELLLLIQDIEEPFSLTNCTFIQTYQKSDEILTE